MQNSPSWQATSCSATHSTPCLLHYTSVHHYFHHSLTHNLPPDFFSPPTFCSHIYSSLNNIIIMAHMFSALQTQCWHTKMRDKRGETMKNQAIPNLTYWSNIGTNNTSCSSNLKPHQLNLTTLLNLNNQTKMTITNTTPTLSCSEHYCKFLLNFLILQSLFLNSESK